MVEYSREKATFVGSVGEYKIYAIREEEPRRCAYCGKPFIAKHPLARYCSQSCRQRYHDVGGPRRPRKCCLPGCDADAKSMGGPYVYCSEEHRFATKHLRELLGLRARDKAPATLVEAGRRALSEGIEDPLDLAERIASLYQETEDA